MKVVDLIESGTRVAAEEYRKIHGAGSFQISLPPEFVAELKLHKGAYVKCELIDGSKILITNPRPVTSETKTEQAKKRA